MNDRASPRMERLVQAAELRDTGLIAGAALRTALARGESILDRMHSPRGQRAKPRAGPALTTPASPRWLHCDVASLARITLCSLPRAEQWACDLALIARRFGCDAGALGGALDQVVGDLVFLTLHAATPDLAARPSLSVRTPAGRLSSRHGRALRQVVMAGLSTRGWILAEVEQPRRLRQTGARVVTAAISSLASG